MGNTYWFDGKEDMIIKSNYLVLTLYRDYFLLGESLCVPVDLLCTDSDVTQSVEVIAGANQTLPYFIYCDYIDYPCKTVLCIPHITNNNDDNVLSVRIRTSVKICGHTFPDQVEIRIATLPNIGTEENLQRAERCLNVIDSSTLVELWKYVDDNSAVDIYEHIRMHLRSGFIQKSDLASWWHEITYLWDENQYSAEFNGVTVKVVGIVQDEYYPPAKDIILSIYKTDIAYTNLPLIIEKQFSSPVVISNEKLPIVICIEETKDADKYVDCHFVIDDEDFYVRIITAHTS